MGKDIATCGHENGISCSVKASTRDCQPCTDFGTYCIDCLRDYYYEDRIEDESVKELCRLAGFKMRVLNNYIGSNVNIKKVYDAMDKFNLEYDSVPRLGIASSIFYCKLMEEVSVSMAPYNQPSSLIINSPMGQLEIRESVGADELEVF